MKARHASALALVGWYLMMPPTSPPNGYVINDAAPLSKWLLMESFDTAESCKKALAKKESDESDRLNVHPSEWNRFTVRAYCAPSASPPTIRA